MKYFYLPFVLSFLLGSCSETDEKARVMFNLTGDEYSKVTLVNPVDMKYDTIFAPATAILERSVSGNGELVQLRTGRQQSYLFLTPGADITVNNNANGEIQILGEHEKEQSLLKEFEKQFSIASMKYGLGNIGNQEETGFISSLEAKYKSLNDKLTLSEQEGVNEVLIDILRARVTAAKAGDVLSYPEYYMYKNGRQPLLTDNYYSNGKGFNLNDPTAYIFPDVKNVGSAYATRNVNFNHFEDFNDYYKAQIKAIDSSVTHSIVSEILKHDVLFRKVNYNVGAGGMEDEIAVYLSESRDLQKKRQIQEDVAKWAHLQKGSIAPDFSAYTRDGQEVRLSDLKGRNIYIDVWATWCGPCIAEIPSLKEVEKRYHEKNIEFVSVSIDADKDKEKWIKMVEERQLTGTQIMTENAWQSELAQIYNIMGIPRFMMIDDEGRIVTADAPRPSQEKSIDNLFASVIK